MQSFEEDKNSQVGLIDRSTRRCVLPPVPSQSRGMTFDDDSPALVQPLIPGTRDLGDEGDV